MKKSWRAILCGVMAIAMTASLAGCGSSDDSSSKSDSSSAAETTAADSSAADESSTDADSSSDESSESSSDDSSTADESSVVYGNYEIEAEDGVDSACADVIKAYFTAIEEQDFDEHHNSGKNRHAAVGIRVRKFRHIAEVHSVPSGNQRQRHENRRDNRQKLHNLILPDVDAGLPQLAKLDRIFLETCNQCTEPLYLVFVNFRQRLGLHVLLRRPLLNRVTCVGEAVVVHAEPRKILSHCKDCFFKIHLFTFVW